MKGRWMKGPGAPFFEAVRDALGALPLIAEDLGAVTPRVLALRDRSRLAGDQGILQFAFGTDASAPSFLPHNYTRDAVVYTGTHDNDTTRGWFDDRGGASGTRSPEQTEKERRTALRYLGVERRPRDPLGHDPRGVRLGGHDGDRSVARRPRTGHRGAHEPRPGTSTGNWEWRVTEAALTRDIGARLADLDAHVRSRSRAHERID